MLIKAFFWLSVIVVFVGMSGDYILAQDTRDHPRSGEADHGVGEAGVETRSTRRSERELIPSVAPVQAGMVSLNFIGAGLIEFIHAIGQHLKLNYTIDPGVKGTVTIFSAEPIKNKDLLPVFHEVLRMNNAVAVKVADFYHIVPIEEGKGLARPVGRRGEDGYALQVVPVRFFSVVELK
ncbi:MAG: hypothetical protein ACE5JU_22255, partial [Candidatus Binatia bacterium]